MKKDLDKIDDRMSKTEEKHEKETIQYIRYISDEYLSIGRKLNDAMNSRTTSMEIAV